MRLTDEQIETISDYITERAGKKVEADFWDERSSVWIFDEDMEILLDDGRRAQVTADIDLYWNEPAISYGEWAVSPETLYMPPVRLLDADEDEYIEVENEEELRVRTQKKIEGLRVYREPAETPSYY